MALADRKPAPLRKGPKCAACVLHESLSAEDRPTFEDWLDGSRLTTRQILDAVKAEGYDVERVGESCLANHRRAYCYGRRYDVI